jgi:hypothetical protein
MQYSYPAATLPILLLWLCIPYLNTCKDYTWHAQAASKADVKCMRKVEVKRMKPCKAPPVSKEDAEWRADGAAFEDEHMSGSAQTKGG